MSPTARSLRAQRTGEGPGCAALTALHEVAARVELNSALPAIEAALAGEARFATSPG